MSDSETNTGNDNNRKKKLKKGIIYLSTVPPFMNVLALTEIMSKFGKVGRIYLQPFVPKPGSKMKRTRANAYTEGWIEFLSKRTAKEVAIRLNSTEVSSRKKSKYFGELWNIKYLPRFKWIHLNERLQYERSVYKHRMRTEIQQAKREANYFSQNVDFSESLKKKKLSARSDVNMAYTQRQVEEEIQKADVNKSESDERTLFLKGLFGTNDS